MGETAIYTSRSTVKSLWQEYRVYGDRVEFDTRFGRMTVPFEQIERVEVSESEVRGLLRGDLHLKGFRPALKLDWANFLEHVVLDRSGGWVRRILFTPEDPEGFRQALQEALERYRKEAEAHRVAFPPELDAMLRSSLKSQYRSGLAMLEEAVRRCPDELLHAAGRPNAFWQIAYHTLFFTHFYLQRTHEEFQPWEGHQAEVQHPDGIGGPADPASSLPLLPRPYTREELLEYCRFLTEEVDEAVDAMDLTRSDSGFYWYPMPKLEHQLVNLRHLQHGAAQLTDRLRSAADIGIDWAGARHPREP